jgi:hypothetical protein
MRAQQCELNQKQLDKLCERVENSGIKPGFKGVKIKDLTRATNKDEALVQTTDILTTLSSLVTQLRKFDMLPVFEQVYIFNEHNQISKCLDIFKSWMDSTPDNIIKSCGTYTKYITDTT